MDSKKKLLGGLLVVLLITVSYTTIHVLTRPRSYGPKPHIAGPVTKVPEEAYARHFPTTFQDQADYVRQFFYLKTNTPQTWVTLPKEANDSIWESKEKADLAQLTAGQSYDVMVLPVQMDHLVVDRTSRLLVAQIIADEIAYSTTQKVMPVELAQRLLGEYSYRFGDQDVMTLTRKYNVKRVISLFLNRDYAARPHYELGYYVKTTGQPDKSGYLFVPGITELHPIEMMAWEKAADIVKQIYPDSTPHLPAKYQAVPAVELGASLIDQVTASSDPYVQAVNLQLLGMLTSYKEAEERHWYMARSLMALRHVDPGTENYYALYSRAMFYLYRRPLALKAIEHEHTPQATALVAMMNGNLPELKENYAKIVDPIFKLFTYLDLNDLAYQYDQQGGGVNYPATNVGWATLIEHRRQDYDYWHAPAATAFLLSIDSLYPAFTKVMLDTFKEKSIVGDVKPQDYKSELLFMDAYSRFMHENKAQLSKDIYGSGATAYDVLRSFRSFGIANILHKLDKLNFTLGLPDDAEQYSEVAEAYLSGDLSFLLRKAEIGDALLNVAQGDARPKYVKSVFESSMLIKNIDAGTDTNTVYAEYYLGKYFNEYRKYNTFPANAYNPNFTLAQDFPSSYVYYELGNDPFALQYTYANFTVLKNAFDRYTRLNSKEKLTVQEKHTLNVAAARHEKMYTVSELDTELANRFNGNPMKIPFLASRYETAGNIVAAIQLLKTAVDAKNENWDVYYQLGLLYLQKNDYQQASDTFLEYPGFAHVKKGKEVETAYNSYEAGSRLYWVGEYDKARPLYEISAKLDTGSAASLNSAARLAILDKNYLQAASIARYAATRYNGEYRYRDYLIWLDLFGYTDQAIAGFKELAPRFNEAQVWSSLFVGQRIKGMTAEKLADWAINYKTTANDRVKEDTDRYIVLQSIVDRNPDDKSIAKADDVIKVDKKQENTTKPITAASVLYGYLTGSVKESVTPAGDKTPAPPAVMHQPSTMVNQPIKPEDLVAVPNQFTLFLSAYQQLTSGHYNKAYDQFTKYSQFYRVENNEYPIGYLPLPYVAYAAIKTGNADRIKQYLKAQPDFEINNKYLFNLTKAILLAGGHDIDGSLQSLDESITSRPEVDRYVVYTWYELLQVCEWLAETTSDKRYLMKALDWAKKYEVIQPQFGYAYAFEAKYSTKTQDRIKAAAFAHYLDPNSLWLASVPKDIKRRAATWWKKYNPFVVPKTNTGSEKMRT